jgi:sRNA-binding protein
MNAMRRFWQGLAIAAMVCGAMSMMPGNSEAAVTQQAGAFNMTGPAHVYDLSVGIDGIPTQETLTPAERRRLERARLERERRERERRERERRRAWERRRALERQRHHRPPPPPPRGHRPPPPRRHWSVDTNIAANSNIQLPSGVSVVME